jgi:hypothetical protein
MTFSCPPRTFFFRPAAQEAAEADVRLRRPQLIGGALARLQKTTCRNHKTVTPALRFVI